MQHTIDYWQLAAGLGLFLFGMHLLEVALSRLAGRRFKQVLKASNAESSDGFGTSVAIDGDTLVVTATKESSISLHATCRTRQLASTTRPANR